MYYNTAAVIDADGTYLGKYRKQHIPQTKGFWEKFYFRPGNGGYPIFETAVGKVGVYICYDRHFPEGWRALGLNGAEIVFNPSATHRGLSEYIWRIEQPAAAVANMYYVGAINRVGIEPLGENDFYGQSYFVDPEGKFVGDVGDAYKPELIVRDLDIDKIKLGPRPLGVLPRPPARRLRRAGRALTMATTLIKNGKVISTTGVIAQDVLIDRRDHHRARRAGLLHRGGRRPRHRRRRQVRDPRRHRRAHAHGAAVRRHVRQRHVRDRIARRGVGWRDHDRRHGRAALRRERASTASPSGIARPTASAPSTTPSTRSSAASTTSR